MDGLGGFVWGCSRRFLCVCGRIIFSCTLEFKYDKRVLVYLGEGFRLCKRLIRIFVYEEENVKIYFE